MTLCCDFLAWRLSLCGPYTPRVPLEVRREEMLRQHNMAWRNLFNAICAYYYALRGQTDSIPEVYAAHRMDTVNTLAPGKPMIGLIENQVYLAQGEWARVLGRSPGLLTMCETLHYDLVALHLRIQMAAACARLGRQDEGFSLLEQALAQAAPDGFVVPFAENFRDLEPLLEAAQEGPYSDTVRRILALGTAQQERCRVLNRSEALPEAAARLTERELTLARLIADRGTNKEIAARMFLSEGTVKQYTNQLYSKLGIGGGAHKACPAGRIVCQKILTLNTNLRLIAFWKDLRYIKGVTWIFLFYLNKNPGKGRRNTMKQRKTIAALSLLLAGCICLSACGGDTAEPFSGSEAEEALYSEETSDTASAAELSDEQREALDDWIWYERGDYTSENWYQIRSDGTVEMHEEYGSTEDTYTAYPMLGCSYNFEGFDVGPDDVPFLSLHMEENVFNSVEIIEDGRAFLTGNASSFPSYYIRSDYTDDEDLHNACVLMYRQWRLDEEHLYLNFYPNHGFILYGQKDLGDNFYGFDADSVHTGRWMVDGDAVSLFWDDGTEDTAVLIPNEHPGDVGEDVSTLSLNGTDLLFNNRW